MPRYTRGMKRYSLQQGAASFQNAAPAKVISVIADAGAIGGQTINMGNPAGSINMLFPGYENCPATMAFSVVIRAKFFSTGNPGLWGIGHVGGSNATSPPSIGSGLNSTNIRSRVILPSGIASPALADFSTAANPPNVAGTAYTDLVWLITRLNGANQFQCYCNTTLLGSITPAFFFNNPIDLSDWPMIGLGLNNVFNSIDAYVSEFAIIEGLINPSSISLESGTGALNGNSRTSFLDIPEYTGITWPAVSLVQTPTTWNEYGVAKVGTLVTPAANQVKTGVQYGASGTQFTGNITSPSQDDVLNGTQYGASGTEFTGNVVLPDEGEVSSGIGFGASGTEFEGNNISPDEYDVRSGVQYGAAGAEFEGTITLPLVQEVLDGVQYGGDGNQFTGTLSTDSTNPGVANVRKGIIYNINGSEFTGTYEVKNFYGAKDTGNIYNNGERIDNLFYKSAEYDSTVEGKENSLYLTGPAEFLCKQIAKHLYEETVWKKFFGENIDPYKRMDYPIRALPALRIYNNSYTKAYESWFIDGEMVLDIIFPASIRRKELEQIPDSITAALLQQFRRPTFFENIGALVPGLNELGKTFQVDKSLAFEWGEDLVPLTQVSLNFRIDLRQWDLYLESDNRTKDEPFSRPLGDLDQIVSTIQGLRDDEEVDVTIEVDQQITDD